MASSPSGVSRQLLASAGGDGHGRVVAWTKTIENLDMKEVELQASHTKVLRDQVTALVHELTAVRQDLNCLKAKQAHHEDNLGFSDTLPGTILSRVVALEHVADGLPSLHECMNKEISGAKQCLQKQAQEIQELKSANVKAAERFEYVEKGHDMIYETHQKDVDEMRQALDKSSKAIDDAKHFAIDQLTPVAKRVDHLEQTTASGFDKDWREIQELRTASTGHASSISQAAQDLLQYRVSVDERLSCLHKLVHESLERHSAELSGLKQVDEKTHREIAGLKSQLPPLECKLDSVDAHLAESFERHSRELSSVRDALAKASVAHAKAEKDVEGLKAGQSRFVSINDQIISLEDSLVEMSANHMKELKDLQGAQDKHSDRVSKDLQHLRGVCADLDHRTGGLGRQLENLESCHAELGMLKEKCQISNEKLSAEIAGLKDHDHKLQSKIATLQEDDDRLLKKIGMLQHDLQAETEKHDSDLTKVKSTLTEHSEVALKGQKDVKMLGEMHGSLHERVSGLETCMKDTADRQAQEVADLKGGHSIMVKDIHLLRNSTSKLSSDTLANSTDQMGIQDRLHALENRLRQCFNVP